MKISTLFFGIILGLSLTASGDVVDKCKYPQQPNIPNGRKATKDEMISAQQAMKAYLAEGDEYITCLDNVEAGWGDDATKEQKAVVVIFHNKIVDDMNQVAELFNSAVRAFKGKN